MDERDRRSGLRRHGAGRKAAKPAVGHRPGEIAVDRRVVCHELDSGDALERRPDLHIDLRDRVRPEELELRLPLLGHVARVQ